MYLQWSDAQPIYVLDKDPEKTVAELAVQNAMGTLAVQPQGRYVIGDTRMGGNGVCGDCRDCWSRGATKSAR